MQVGFVIGTFDAKVRLQIIQHDQVVFRQDYTPQQNSETRCDVDRLIDPSVPFTIRLTNLGDQKMPVYVKNGLDNARRRLILSEVPPIDVGDGLSGSLIARAS
jgi:hypothetical protein